MSSSTSIPNSRSPQESQTAARQPNFQLNAFYLGDNLNVLRSFDSGTVDLIATDPPFNKKRDAFEGELKGGGKAKFKDNWHWVDPDPDKGKRHDPDAVENHVDWLESIEKHHHRVHALITATRDVYGDDMAAFLCWMGVRILEMHRVLKPTGSVYLHCDTTASHYLKALMDAVFGKQNFRNEIVWRRSGGKSDAKRWGRVSDRLLYYTSGSEFTWNQQYQPHDPDYIRKAYRYEDTDGRGVYRVTPLHAAGQSAGESGEPWRGIDPGKIGNHWRTPTKGVMNDFIIENDIIPGWPDKYPSVHARLDALDQAGLVVHGSGLPGLKTYLAATRGVAAADIVADIPMASGNERTGYPTQKPLALYERIVGASSNPGDIVLDPFAGCATTAVAAQHLHRNWVAIDIEAEGYNVTKQRMSDERALDQHTIVIGPAITDLPVRMDDGRTEADPLNPEPRKQRPPSKIDKDRDRKLDTLIAEFGLQCWGCGFTPPGDAGQLHGRDFFELDHIRPQSELGTHDILNRAILCGPCNKRKGGFGGTLADLRKQNETAQRLYGRLLDMAEVVDWHARYDPGEEKVLLF